MSYTQRIIDPYGYGAEMLARQKSQEAGMPLSFKSNGRQYTLKPDLQMQARLEAGEKEAARRSGRKEQKILPTFRYVDPSGKPFEGTWMGTGSYGGFGPATQTSQRSWSNYTGDRPISGWNYKDSPSWKKGGTGIPERSGPRNPDYGSNPEKIAKAMAPEQEEGGSRLKPPPEGFVYNRFGYLEPKEWYSEEEGGALTKKKGYEFAPPAPPSPTVSTIISGYGSAYSNTPMGFSGPPLSFTLPASRAGMLPSPTGTSTLPSFPEFLPDYSSLTGFGGILTFPASKYY